MKSIHFLLALAMLVAVGGAVQAAADKTPDPVILKDGNAHPVKTFNARDYGAIPDGMIDAGPGIRAAIAAATASGDYSEVLLEPGQYRIRSLKDGRFHITLNGAKNFTLLVL